MTGPSALAYAGLALAVLAWLSAVALLPAEHRWRRLAGIVVGSLVAGAVTWLFVFSAGAAVTIAGGGGYVPMGEYATAAGGAVAAAASLAVVLLQRRHRAS